MPPVGKTWREALRVLEHHLVRVIWQRWQPCELAGPRQESARELDYSHIR